MSIDFFSLPGPREFVNTATNAFMQGKSLLVDIPECLQQEFIGALKTSTDPHNDITWQIFRRTAGSPLQSLLDDFGADVSRSDNIVLSSLLKYSTLPGTVTVILEIDPENWASWRSFLDDTAEYNRSFASIDMIQFIVFLPNACKPLAPRDNLLLSYHFWEGVIQDSDIKSYVYQIIQTKPWSTFRRHLVSSLCAQLAMWDRQLCDELVTEPIETLLEPLSFLQKYGTNCGWHLLPGNDVATAPSHEFRQRFEDRLEYHSAYIALTSDAEKINRKVWAAELVVIFPYIEIKRINILEQIGRELIPFTSNIFGTVIDDPMELEIGQIAYALDRNTRLVGNQMNIFVKSLAVARNALAHLQPVPKHLITSGVLETQPSFL
jgi:hypothetical protein